jgi:hypothetical protein
MIISIKKDYAEDVSGVMGPSMWTESGKMDAPVFYFASITIRNVPELQAQYPFMGIKNIGEPVDTLSQFHYDTHDTDRL